MSISPTPTKYMVSPKSPTWKTQSPASTACVCSRITSALMNASSHSANIGTERTSSSCSDMYSSADTVGGIAADSCSIDLMSKPPLTLYRKVVYRIILSLSAGLTSWKRVNSLIRSSCTCCLRPDWSKREMIAEMLPNTVP